MTVVVICSGAGGARLLGTYDFLKEIGKVGGFKHDVTAFYQRWILGRGCPRLHAAFVFNRCTTLRPAACKGL